MKWYDRYFLVTIFVVGIALIIDMWLYQRFDVYVLPIITITITFLAVGLWIVEIIKRTSK